MNNQMTCVECGKESAKVDYIDHTATIKYDGVQYSVRVPELQVVKCVDCHDFVLTPTGRGQIQEALRAQLGLLQPAQIRRLRAAMGKTQREVADALEIAHETISRWESGAVIQSKLYDKTLRAYFAVPSFRDFMDNPGGVYKAVPDVAVYLNDSTPGLWTTPIIQAAPTEEKCVAVNNVYALAA